MTPLQFGQYRVVLGEDGEPEIIGEGQGGIVYRAVHEHIRTREVAVKCYADLRQKAGWDAIETLHEQSYGLPKVYDAGPCPDGAQYVVMELLRGGSLTEQLEKLRQDHRTMDLPIALKYTRQIAETLALLDPNVHRDLKPANLIVREGAPGTGHVCLLDCGAWVLGTPAYASPEQLAGESFEDPAIDVYALGSLLWEMLTGEVPYPAGSEERSIDEWVELKRENEPDWLQIAALPSEVQGLIREMLKTEPRERMASPDRVWLGSAARRVARRPSEAAGAPSRIQFWRVQPWQCSRSGRGGIRVGEDPNRRGSDRCPIDPPL
jgi:serine/threonine protein kinase